MTKIYYCKIQSTAKQEERDNPKNWQMALHQIKMLLHSNGAIPGVKTAYATGKMFANHRSD